MRKISLCVVGLLLMIVVLSACGAQQNTQLTPSQPIVSDAVHIPTNPTPTPAFAIQSQIATPTPTPDPVPTRAKTNPNPNPGNPPPSGFPGTGSGSAPYGPPPPLSSEEIQLTQQLFALINHDRAVRNLYPFIWNNTLAGGARLHSWNMFHCGFSHTCPDGLDQCTRIANEGFAGFTDCGECIGLAGPISDIWSAIYSVQESMINEPPDGWHRIHLTSTTLHSIGVGIFLDATGQAWFTEDMVSQA